MQFDSFTIVLLVTRADGPELDEQAADALQDAHLAHLAGLHEAGHLLAAGPLRGDPELRGLLILNVPPEQARALEEADPRVQAGVFSIRVIPWVVPAGAMAFSPTGFPRSIAEAAG